MFDTSTDGATASLVMGLLRGPSLEARLEHTGALPVADAVAIGMQIAAALAAAHAAGVVPRDVDVADFGIAWRRFDEAIAAATAQTGTGPVIRRPAVFGWPPSVSAPKPRGVP